MLLFQDWSPWLVSFWFCQSFRLPRIGDRGVLDYAFFGDGEGVTKVSFEVDHFGGESVTGDGDEAGAVLDDDAFHEGDGAAATDAGAAVSGDDLNHSVVWVESGAFAVGSITGRVAIAVVKDDSVGNGGGVVGSVDEHGAFVDVGVAGEDDVDAAAFENGHDVLTHFDELTFFV